MKTSLSDIRQLVAELHADPDDDDKFSVVVDWCEEIGFHEVVQLRDPSSAANRSLFRYQAIHALRVLFGDPSSPMGAESRARYTAVLGFPMSTVAAGDTATFTTQPEANFLARRLVIPAALGQYFRVHDLVLGKWHVFLGSEGIDGVMFGEYMPDLFERLVTPSNQVRVTLENISPVDVRFQCCMFGDDAELLPKSPAALLSDISIQGELTKEIVTELKEQMAHLSKRVQETESALIKVLSR